MVTREDSIRREALARDLGRRQAIASHDELRVVDMILIALERMRDREGPLDLDEDGRDQAEWRRQAVLTAAALEALPDARFDGVGASAGYRAGWNAAIDHVIAAFQQAQDGRAFEAIAHLKQIDRERSALYEAAATEHLERLELGRTRTKCLTVDGATELDGVAEGVLLQRRETVRIIKTPTVDFAFDMSDLDDSVESGGGA